MRNWQPGNVTILVVGSTQPQYPHKGCNPGHLGQSSSCCSHPLLPIFIPVPLVTWKHPQPSGFAKIHTLTFCISGCLANNRLYGYLDFEVLYKQLILS